MAEWQPIETAEQGEWMVVVDARNRPRARRPQVLRWFSLEDEFTHWLPLPPLPAEPDA